MDYPEYDWIQKSIDATLAENERARALIERLKNPVECTYVELDSGHKTGRLELIIPEN